MNGKQVRLASISGQPLLLSKGRYNLRKLHELPVQLIRSQRWNELKNEVLCNFYWLKTKIEVRSLRWGNFFWLALNESEAGVELCFVRNLTSFKHTSFSYAYELHRGFYQEEVDANLASTRRLDCLAYNCKLAYCLWKCSADFDQVPAQLEQAFTVVL